MWKTLKMFFIIERSNKSNYYTLLLVVALIIGISYMASKDSYNNPIAKSTADYQSTSSAINKFQIVDINSVDNSETMFGYLTRLRQSIALELAALKTEKDNMLQVALSRKLTLREQIYNSDEFYKIKEFIPPKIHNDNERLFIEKLNEKELPIKQESLQFWPFLLSIFSTIGIAWFPFLSFYTSGIMIDDFNHSTVLRGYPIRFDKYVIAKSISKFIMILAFIALIVIISLPLIKWKGVGAYDYPVIIYMYESIALSIPTYILLCIFYMLVITVFTLLFSILLNMLVKNMYVTFFIQTILYFLPITFPNLINFLPYNPFNYLNFNFILEGGPLMLESAVNVTFVEGFILLFLCIIGLIVLVQRYLSAGLIKRV